jgi:tetratricopeptide (TPR) repeat protein
MKLHNFIILFLCTIIQYPAISRIKDPLNSLSRENKYFQLKEMGRYQEAIEIIKDGSEALDDPSSAEIYLFRLQELLAYAELRPKMLETLAAISKSKAVLKSRFLQDRIDIIKNDLLLNTGDMKSSMAIRNSLSFFDFYVMGPFTNHGNRGFKMPLPPLPGVDKKRPFGISMGARTWFKAEADSAGIVDLDDLFGETENMFFYLYRKILIERGGEYCLMMGTTGHTDIWLDGALIFSSRTEHGFNHDQYFISAYLPEGSHRILIKTGGSHDGTKIAFRMTDSKGVRMRPTPSVPAVDSKKEAPAIVREIGVFPSLSALLKRRDPTPDELFATGYLYYASRLGHGNTATAKHLSGIPEQHARYSSACYYVAMTEDDPEKRDEMLKKSLRANPENIEALREMALIRVRRGSTYEAYPLIADIKQVYKLSPWHHESLVHLLIRKRWFPEALLHTEILKRSQFPSLGYQLEASIHAASGDHLHALKDLESLLEYKRWDRPNFIRLLDCYENIGNYDEAARKLHQAVVVFPASVAFKLRLARLIGIREGASAALPCLAAALKTSPYNKHALQAIGNAYYNLGQTKLAVYYLSQSLQFDPGNRELRQRISIIKNK